MTNSDILRQMKKIYYPQNKEYLDFMGFRITNENYPTYHHIVKARTQKDNNEDSTPIISNGAYLGKKSHDLLHRIEHKDKELYEAWNKIFEIIVEMKIYPIDDIWNMIFDLQERTLEIDKKIK